jgi:hypothetical protein
MGAGTPAEGDVCPSAAPEIVGNGSTMTEGISYPDTASSPATCVSTPCFGSLGFNQAVLKKKRKRKSG